MPWSAFLMPSASSEGDGTGLGTTMADMIGDGNAQQPVTDGRSIVFEPLQWPPTN